MAKKTILAIGDLHFPFANGKSLKTTLEIANSLKPDVIVQIGDLYDMFSFGRFPRSMDHMTPKKELERGRDLAEDLWFRLSKAAPKAKLFQLKGNHDERIHKRVLVSFPEAESIINIHGLFSFRGVETMATERDELIINDILFMHGFRTKLGDHAIHNRMSTVCGHSHTGGVVYVRLGNETLFELNCGFQAQEDSFALSYTRQRKISKWTQGVGLIDEYGPRFIPYPNKE